MTQALGVAVVGFGWMGRVHTQAYLRVPHHFSQLEVRPELVAVADEVPGRAEEAAARYGFVTASRDWREVATDPRVRAVSITAPNFLHREIGTAMAEAGKHIWIEKPVGLTAADARAVAEAARRAGVQGTVGFNYRNAPAVEVARDLIAAGRIGEVKHVAFHMLSDYSAHPDGALSWRFVRELAGSGVIGDLGSHGLDLAQYVVGPVDQLLAEDATFIPERPEAVGAASHFSRGADGPRRTVENEDYGAVLARFAPNSRGPGAVGTLECSRVVVGPQCGLSIEVYGTEGSATWNFERMNELKLAVGRERPACSGRHE